MVYTIVLSIIIILHCLIQYNKRVVQNTGAGNLYRPYVTTSIRGATDRRTAVLFVILFFFFTFRSGAEVRFVYTAFALRKEGGGCFFFLPFVGLLLFPPSPSTRFYAARDNRNHRHYRRPRRAGRIILRTSVAVPTTPPRSAPARSINAHYYRVASNEKGGIVGARGHILQQ